jgi:predicted anti-sigma-YlaC factor YlaD
MNDLEPIAPCGHMRGLLSRLADGTLTGLALWFARQHLGGCVRCRSAHSALVRLREQLARLHGGTDRLEADRREALEQTLDSLEKQQPG